MSSKITNEEFDAALAEKMDEHPASALLELPGVYEIVAEHFNNDILADYGSEHPTKYRIMSDRYAAHSEPVTMEEFVDMCDENGWDEPDMVMKIGKLDGRETWQDRDTGEVILEEVA